MKRIPKSKSLTNIINKNKGSSTAVSARSLSAPQTVAANSLPQHLLLPSDMKNLSFQMASPTSLTSTMSKTPGHWTTALLSFLISEQQPVLDIDERGDLFKHEPQQDINFDSSLFEPRPLKPNYCFSLQSEYNAPPPLAPDGVTSTVALSMPPACSDDCNDDELIFFEGQKFFPLEL
jgi:hypothetical protein